MTTKVAPTFGQKAVGLSFNPTVNRIKAIFAEAIDLCDSARKAAGASQETKRLYSIAITEAQGAQMWAVKAATWQE